MQQSLPRKDVILNLPGFILKKVTNYSPMILEVEYKGKMECVYCQSKKLRKKDKFIRRVKHETVGLRTTVLEFVAHKYYCKTCQRYFNGRYPGIIKYQRASEKLKEQVAHQHTQGVSQKDLAVNFKLGKATIERWYQYYYVRLNQEIKHRHCPRVLGIDEHFFTKKQGYATTLCDLRKHRVFDVVKGRCESDLKDYLLQLTGREKVQVICMDLSRSYRKIVREYFPNAKIVSDRFHVIRLLNHQAMQAYHQVDPELKYQRGLLGILRSVSDDRLSAKQQQRELYFKRFAKAQKIHQLKQKMYQILMKKSCTKRRCKRLIPLLLGYLQRFRSQPFESLQKLSRTLYEWKEEIMRMWRFTKNNGITEGFHRKMKLIQRRAYGFRNFENYRLRVRILCG